MSNNASTTSPQSKPQKKTKSPPFKDRLSQIFPPIDEINQKQVLRKQSQMNIENKFSKNNMIVAVRCRPMNQKEMDFSNITTVSITNREIVTVTEPLEYKSIPNGEYYLNNESSLEIKKTKDYEFAFDFAFNESTSQEEVYLYTTEKLLLNVIDGFNSTVFAYGATGSGKTYSMVGNGKMPGIMIRAISDLFKLVEQEKKSRKFNIQLSYIEVYNEILNDLFNVNDNGSEKLIIREDPDKGVYVSGAIFHKVTNANDAYQLIVNGNKKRKEEPTEINENSSRSHAILQISFEIEESKNQNEITFGKFVLVDLAGSEKISKTVKTNANESSSINKSLLALSDCIRLLVNGKKSQFIRWRDSKLTRILKDSLTGNCRIVMLATISPSITSIEETLYTLQYANTAKNIKVKLTKNIIEQKQIPKFDEIINDLNSQIEKVKNELYDKNGKSKLQIQFQLKLNNSNSENNEENNKNSISDADMEKYQKKLIDHFNEELQIRNEIINKENEIEEIKNKINNYQIQLANNTDIKNMNNYNKAVSLILSSKSDISKKQKELNNIYAKQGNLLKRRKEIENLVSRLTVVQNTLNINNTNPLYKNLALIYRYYITYLENVLSEHRKFKDQNEIVRKDKLIQCLSSQLDYRDQFIIKAGEEIHKNNGEFKYNNEALITADEIELNPYKPLIVKVIPDIQHTKIKRLAHLAKNNKSFDINANNKSISHEVDYNTQQINIRYNNINREKYENKYIITPAKVSSKRQIKNEIIPLFQEKKNFDSIKKFGRVGRYNKLSINTLGNKQFQNSYKSFGYSNINNNNGRVNTENLPYISNKKKKQDYYSNVNNRSFSSSGYSNSGKNNDSFDSSFKFNNEIQQKVKTLISKNYLGRYRRSPYIQNY